ncbi:MAG: TlyA family RNA methyltransferase, partial [Eubacterium sp.]|nr:TlyA family RNA methyltransferase [Eubacterium sp.]
MSKERLDVLLVNRGLIETRSKAKAVIMAGEVFVDGQREDKAGAMFPEEVHIELRGKQMPYVSRGGFKLEKALKVFDISLEGLTCMDVGSSTGGFTDCMLQNGAVRVYAVDVGTNQLAWKLRQDDRVVVMEKTNIRYLTPEDMVKVLDGDGSDESERGADVHPVGADDTREESRGWTGVDFASIDVAFISLEKVFAPLRALLKDNAEVVALIKPQFEAGREQVGKKGVVREPNIHEDVIKRVIGYATEAGYSVIG